MEIVVGGTKQDEAPVDHAAAYPCCHKKNMWTDHPSRVHLAAAVKARATKLDEPCDSLAIPPKN